MSREWSLRRRLTSQLALAVLAAWCLSAALLYRAAVINTNTNDDSLLVHLAHAVLAVVRDEAGEFSDLDGSVGRELASIDHTDQTDFVYQVLGPNGSMMFRSHGAPRAPLAPADARGFTDTVIAGHRYRVYSLSAELNVATIHAAQPLERRSAIARSDAVHLLLPGVLLMSALGLAVAWSIRRTTEPIVRYASNIEGLALESERSIDGSQLPEEMTPVSRAINGLLGRVQAALLHERTITADAAHELRTPLAALRVRAQVALRTTDDALRAETLRELMGAADRAARVVETVLLLARYDSQSSSREEWQPQLLSPLAQVITMDFREVCRRRGIRIHVEVDDSEILCDPDAIGIAISNLLDNAVRFARSTVRLQIRRQDLEVLVRVIDDGPGFSPESAQRAFHRFYRDASGGPSSDGAGLGLALVQRIVALHGGTVQIRGDAPSGAELIVRLRIMHPPAASAQPPFAPVVFSWVEPDADTAACSVRPLRSVPTPTRASLVRSVEPSVARD